MKNHVLTAALAGCCLIALAAGFYWGRRTAPPQLPQPLPTLPGMEPGQTAFPGATVAEADLDAFLALVPDGDFARLEAAGRATFVAGARLPPGWALKLAPYLQGGPPTVTTYVFLDNADGGEQRKVLVVVNAGQGVVVEFLAEALRLIASAPPPERRQSIE